jgi:hypothetical protein
MLQNPIFCQIYVTTFCQISTNSETKGENVELVYSYSHYFDEKFVSRNCEKIGKFTGVRLSSRLSCAVLRICEYFILLHEFFKEFSMNCYELCKFFSL